MAGTKAGGARAAQTNKERYGEDFYAQIGRKGGQNGHTERIDQREAVSLGEYTLFSDGEILSKDGKPMVPQKDAKGYLRIRLRYGNVDKYGACTYKVHRLVAESFIPNPQKKPQVNHIDGDKTNNNVDNLEWVTNAENSEHANRSGLINNRSAEMDSLGGQIKTAIRRRVSEFENEPITTLKVGRKRCFFYYDKSRRKYRVEANDRIPVGKQFSNINDAQAYVNKFYHPGGFAANPALARVAGAIGGRKSKRGPSKKKSAEALAAEILESE